MPAKKSKTTSKKINDIGAPKASVSSRPIIVSNPTVTDPMVTPTPGSEAPALSTHGRTIEPPKHTEANQDEAADKPVDDSGSEPVSAGASPSDIIEKAKARRATSDEASDPAPEEGHEDSPKDSETVEKAKPESEESKGEAANDEEDDKSASADNAAAEAPAESQNAKDEAAASEEPGPDKKSDDDAKTEAERIEAERQAKYNEMIRSEKYFVPIGAVRRRRARYWLLALGVLVIAVVVVDLLLDAGIIKISNFNFYTNFIVD